MAKTIEARNTIKVVTAQKWGGNWKTLYRILNNIHDSSYLYYLCIKAMTISRIEKECVGTEVSIQIGRHRKKKNNELRVNILQKRSNIYARKSYNQITLHIVLPSIKRARNS